MAINLHSKFPSKTMAPTAEYPFGSARNIINAGDNTGTPWDESIANDWYGFLSSVLSASGQSPSGLSEKGSESQLKDGLLAISARRLSSCAELRSIEPTQNNTLCIALGHTQVGIGGGIFYHDAADTNTEDDNGITYVTAAGKRWKRLFDGPINVAWYGAIGDGINDDSVPFGAAFYRASILNIGEVYIPPCKKYYLIGDVFVQDKLVIRGCSRYRYTAPNVGDIEGHNAIVYDTSKTDFIGFGYGVRVENLTFHGVNKTKSIAGLQNSHWINSAVFGCDNGFGGENLVGAGNCRLINCHFANNNNGITALRDSHITNCEINANSQDGIKFVSGSNDNTLSGNKVEWNDGAGYRFFGGQKHNIIMGGIVDRNGKSGIELNDNYDLQLSSVKLRRNGRLSENDDANNAHIVINGNGSVGSKHLTISNISTDSGGDDGGGGYISPAHVLVCNNNIGLVDCMISSNLDGTNKTTHAGIFKARNGGKLIIKSLSACSVENENLLTGDVKIQSASANWGYYSEGEKITEATQSVNSNVNVSLQTFITSMPNFSRTSFKMAVESRNSSTGSSNYQEKIVILRKESGAISADMFDSLDTGNGPEITLSSFSSGSLNFVFGPNASTSNNFFCWIRLIALESISLSKPSNSD